VRAAVGVGAAVLRPAGPSKRTSNSRRTVAMSMRTLAALMLSMILLTTTLFALALAQSRDLPPQTPVNRAAGVDRWVDIGGR
jgi:hypothetical protein